MTQTFRDLGLNSNLLNTLERLNYEQPTAIQAEAIPVLLAGKDVLGQAQTGTGKTAAFALPLLQQMTGNGLETLILAPTRELAIQVSEAIYEYGRDLGMRVLPVYGGTSYTHQIRRLKKGVDIVVGTPGRTLDLIRKGILDLSDVRFMVFDEADEMLNMGFIDDVEAILSATPAETRQTLLFSATFNQQILRLSRKYMRDPVHIEIEGDQLTADNIEQRYYVVNDGDKMAALARLLETEETDNVLIFTRTRAGSTKTAERLIERGYPAIAIHGELAQDKRERILNRFRDGSLRILVATDVIGRGVDIPDISHVINYDIPHVPNEYVHRIGRTGRAGSSGIALTFVTLKQRYRIQKIERHIQTPIVKSNLPTPDDVQRARDNVFKEALKTHIDAVDSDENLDIIDSLLAEGYQAEQIVSGMLRMLRTDDSDDALEDIRDPMDNPGKRHHGSKKKRNRRRDDSNMVRLQMSLGKSSGIKPGDVVYTVASSANIPGHVIGAITIERHQTLVDIPQTHVQSVLNKTNHAKMRGKKMSVVRA